MRASDLKTNYPEIRPGVPAPPQQAETSPGLSNFAGGDRLEDSGFDEEELSIDPSTSPDVDGEHHGH